MTHPVELLAEYVDGALMPSDQALVDAHLAGCRSCRNEIEAADAARRALSTLDAPSSVPSGVGAPALAEMSRTRSGATTPRWIRVLPIAAAAVLVGLLAVVIPRIGSDASGDATSAPETVAADQRGELRLVAGNRDLDPSSLEAAAEAYVSDQRIAEAAEASGVAGASAAAPPAPTLGIAKTEAALACVRSAFEGFPGTVVGLERVIFEGSPAILATVLEGPGAGQPPDTVSLWVASVPDCSTVSIASASL